MRIGIDLGGTKTEIAVLDAKGRLILRRRAATPSGDYEGTLTLIATLVRDAEAECGRRCTIGIGTPGSPSPALGLMRNSNSICLNGKPLQRDLEKLLGREIRIANDANCMVLSEAVDGAGSGRNVVFGVILGTGVGGGLVVGNHVLTGPNAIAGEWGHNPLPWPTDDERPGRACFCGKRGCIETWLSGPGLAADHEATGGGMCRAEDIVAKAIAGDTASLATLTRYHERLARALAAMMNIVDPDVIVLAGGMSNIPDLCARVAERLPRWVFSDVVRTRIVAAKHGDSSGVRGAAWLWND